MLIDTVTLMVRAGNGGNGAASFIRNAMTARGGPDGGTGGNGGNISIIGSTNIQDLAQFRYKKKIVGNDGGNGTKHNGFGKNAEHITILVPLGTRITDTASGKVIEINQLDLPVVVARGGRGGFGNAKYKSATNQSPKHRELGEPGEVKTLELELRMIAQIGLVGLPNAGKSSLLAALTHATPKIGAYPFTTLSPNIGMLEHFAIADIPGLIEGASKGIGLGLQFLKHIEKTNILVHLIDITSPHPIEDYETVRNEFALYNKALLDKQEIIALNKSDLVSPDTAKKVQKLFSDHDKPVIIMSVYDPKSMQTLANLLQSSLKTA
jgi:GTPase